MKAQRLIVVGASAGGVKALSRLVADLPADLPAAVLIVLHIAASRPSYLAGILGRVAKLPVAQARGGELLEEGQVFIAPPDHHLLVVDGVTRLSHGPRENRHRPAVDALFRSAAEVYGPNAIGVILTGSLYDGTAGLMVIKRHQGLAVVQDPEDAYRANMPRSALRHVEADYVLPLEEIGPTLARLVSEPVPKPAGGSPETRVARRHGELIHEDLAAFEKGLPSAGPSVLTCPDCGGVLWEVEEGDLSRYHCHVGHVYSEESLFTGQEERLEAALWTAVRVMDEKAVYARHWARRHREAGRDERAEEYLAQAVDADARSALIREVLEANERAFLPEEPEPGDESPAY
jgi:two-component system chemotaxis response regulator CheB